MEVPSASEITRQNLMLPPSSGTFQNREDLVKYVREFGVSQGYIATIKKSKKDRRVILGCDRGGIYRNRRKIDESKRKRKASSRLINCPFEAIGKKDDDVWLLTIKNGEHNHEPLRDMSEHPYSRRFTEEEVEQIKLMTEAGVKPRQVLKALKQSNPDLHSTPRHLYNVKAKIRQGFSEKSFKSWRPNLSVSVSASTEKSASVFSLKITNYIGGKFLESQACELIDVISPATQEVVSQVPMTTYEELKAAVVAAKQAFPAWKNTPVSARQHVMFKLQELIRRDIDKISMSIAIEQGKTLNSAKADILYGLELIERACGLATLLMGKYIPNAANGVDAFCSREPLGVCAGICLSDLPAMIPLWMFPIAVTCGNAYILKPSEKNPGASMIIAALAAEAGLPDGVLNIVHGNHEIAKNICEDEDINAISLNRSNSAGMDIYARAVARGKRIQPNVEVKNHIVIMPDASVDAALDATLASGFGASGIPSFMAPSVAVFVGGSTQWEKELVECAKELKVNAGTEPGTDIGPVISKEAKDRTCKIVQSSISSGARLVLDGRHIVVPRYEQGNFLGPTIMCDVTTSMDCYKEDMVGPVLLCMQAKNLEEAIAIVNSSKFRSGASIFTSSCVAARRFQNEIETSLVGINVPVPLSLPLSLYNGSNIAGDLNFSGKTDVHFYTQKKTVVQYWKELPRGRLPLPHPPTFETERSGRGISALQLPASERDFVVSKAMPSAVTELPCDNVSLSFPQSAEEDLPIPGSFHSASSIPETELPRYEGLSPSTSKRDPMNQELSKMMHSATSVDAVGRGVSTSMPSSARDSMFSWGETPLALQRSENMISTSDSVYAPLESEMIDVVASTAPSEAINVASAPTTEGFYIPTMSLRNENMAMMSLAHDTHPIAERVYLPLMSQQNQNLVPTSQRSEMSMQTQRTDNMRLTCMNRDVPMHRASGLYTPYVGLPQTTNAVPRLTEMHSASAIQSNDGVSLSPSSERIFIPTTSQETFDKMPKISSVEECHRKGVP